MSEETCRVIRTSSPASAPRAPLLGVVHWSYPNGVTVAGCPLEYRRAEALAEAYRSMYPDRTAWVVPPSALASPRP